MGVTVLGRKTCKYKMLSTTIWQWILSLFSFFFFFNRFLGSVFILTYKVNKATGLQYVNRVYYF